MNPTFTDMHTHILFAVDDGPKNVDDSLRMLEQAAENRIGQILATPHITDIMDDDNGKRIQDHFKVLKLKLAESKLPIELYLASELFFNDRIYNWLDQSWVSFNAKNRYILFELPLFDLPEGVDEFIFTAKLRGITPILAHPERYIYLHNKLPLILKWYYQGCLMQMNAGSLTGQFGTEVNSLTRRLLQSGLYSFIASDAHDIDGRNFKVLTKAFEIANGILSKSQVDELFIYNPNMAISNKPILQNEINEKLLDKGWLKEIISRVKKYRFKVN